MAFSGSLLPWVLLSICLESNEMKERHNASPGEIYIRPCSNGTFEEIFYRPSFQEELQALVNKYVSEGWNVASITHPHPGYPGYVRFYRTQEQVLHD